MTETRPEKQARKRAEAEGRQAKAASMSPGDRLIALDELLGPGLGAKKEREKLFKALEAPPREETKKPRKKRRQRGER